MFFDLCLEGYGGRGNKRSDKVMSKCKKLKIDVLMFLLKQSQIVD